MCRFKEVPQRNCSFVRLVFITPTTEPRRRRSGPKSQEVGAGETRELIMFQRSTVTTRSQFNVSITVVDIKGSDQELVSRLQFHVASAMQHPNSAVSTPLQWMYKIRAIKKKDTVTHSDSQAT